MTLWNIVSAVGRSRGTETGEDPHPGSDGAESDGADTLLDTLPRPSFIVDADHRVVGWNREMTPSPS